MFDNSRRQNREYTAFLEGKNSEMVDRLNNRGRDMDRAVLAWLARAFALIALIVGIGYIALFFVNVS